MKIISTIAALALLGASGGVLAGEESTDNWGAGGTGPAFWQTQCGLKNFPGPTADAPRPCTVSGIHYAADSKDVVRIPAPSAAGASPVRPTGVFSGAGDGHGGRKTPDARK